MLFKGRFPRRTSGPQRPSLAKVYRFRPIGERLEDRLPLTVDFSGGIITCTGDDTADSFFVSLQGNAFQVNGAFVVSQGITATLANTSEIDMFGLGGNDFLLVDSDIFIPAFLHGGDGDDTLRGGAGSDTLDGGVNTAGGRDVIVAGADADFVLTNGSLTGLGSDTLIGIEEARLTGGASANTLEASAFTAGPVTLSGLDGNDVLIGGSGDDQLDGGDGDDRLIGNAGKDTMFGGDGKDELHGGLGNDQMFGGSGDDTMFGDEGNDRLDGEDGNDELRGADGDDSLSGGADNDLLFGDAGQDSLGGGDGIDELHGGDDADTLSGGKGSDTLFGDGGDDFFQGDTDGDTLDGGAGNFDGLSIGNAAGQVDNSYLVTATKIVSDTDGTVTISGGIEQVNLIGGPNDNTFTIGGFYKQINVAGKAGNDVVDFQLDFPKITPMGSNTTGLPEIDYSDPSTGRAGRLVSDGHFIERFQLHLGPGDNNVDLSQWTGNIEELAGGGGLNTISVTRDDDMTVTDGKLAFGKGGQILFSDFAFVALTGGPSNNKLDAVAFSGAVRLSGEEGDDTLLGTQHDDDLFGGPGDDFLNGFAGKDVLKGDDGNDELLGGLDNDILDGGAGNDALDGGFGDDVLTGGTGKNNLDGGIGNDTIKETGDIPAFTLTSKKLTGPGTDTHVNIERAELHGGAGKNVFTFDNFIGVGESNVFGEGGTQDQVIIKANHDFGAGFSPPFQALASVWDNAAGQMTSLLCHDIQALSLVGGSAANVFSLTDLSSNLVPPIVSISGGGGNDTFKYDGTDLGDTDFTLAADKLTVSQRAFPIALSKVENVELTGGAGRNTFDVSGWKNGAKIDGGGNGLTTKLKSTNSAKFTLSETNLSRSDKGHFDYTNINNIELVGGGKADSLTVNASANMAHFPSILTFDGAGGKDQVTLNLKAGGIGTEAHLTTSLLEFGLASANALKSLFVENVEQFQLNGDAGPDTFRVDSDFPGKVSMNGGGGDDDRFDLTLRDSLDVTAADAAVTLSNGVKYALTAIEDFIVTVGTGHTSRVDISAWTHAGELIGSGADVTLVATNNLPTMQLTEDTLTRSGIGFLLANVKTAILTGGSGANIIDATGFTGKAILNGLGGNDKLTGGSGDDELNGGAGNDTLDGGPGTDTLDGGPGVDTVLNPEPSDILKNIP